MRLLAPDTQATLLLTGRLGTNPGEFRPLLAGEYNQLAKELHEKGLRPANLLDAHLPELVSIEGTRLRALLKRGTQLALVVERWNQVGIEVIGRTDGAYPDRLRVKLRGGAPPIIYGAGRWGLLDRDGVCVVGSRDATVEGLGFARELGRECSAEGLAVVSGDARGIDREAMLACIDSGGASIGILAETLMRTALSKRWREAIISGNLLLMSPYDPEEAFSIAHAMERNRYLYAMSKAAVVVDSDTKGGTWSGAVENHRRKWVPAFVRTGEGVPPGNSQLAEMGLIALPHHGRPQGWLRRLLSTESNAPAPELPMAEVKTFDLTPSLDREDRRPDPAFDLQGPSGSEVPHAEYFYKCFLARLTDYIRVEPRSIADIATHLGLVVPQAKVWLDCALAAGTIKQFKRPTRFGMEQGFLPSLGKTGPGRPKQNA